MKKNFMKRGGVLLMAGLMAASMVACGWGGDRFDDGAQTEINFLHYQGTAGIEWLEEAAARFSTLKKDEVYEEGKQGVIVNVAQKQTMPYATLESDGYDIYLDESRANIYSYSAQEKLLNLDDIVEGIENRIDSDAIQRMKGADGHYYGLPSYEWFTGIAYDIDYFNAENLYFAAPTEEAVVTLPETNAKFGKAKFIADADAEKSVGPNGVKGDYDDGLPSSLQEMVILCATIKEKGHSPFIIAGSGDSYAFHLTHALWASIAGADAMRSIYTNYGSEPIRMVTGYSDTETMFSSDSGLPKPIVEEVVLTDENGYKMYDMEARYYALSFIELMLKEDWFHASSKDPNGSNLNADNLFINPNLRGNTQAAMLIDGSYWYHEAQEDGAFETYKQLNPDSEGRNIGYMPLPTQIEGSVTEGNGKENTLMNVGSAFVFANKNVSKNPRRERAVRDFLKFLYTDSELATFTEKLGLTLPMEYTYDTSNFDSYYAQLSTVRNASKVINYASSNTRFLKNMDAFSLYWGAPIQMFKVNGKDVTNGYLYAFKQLNASAKDIFQATQKTESAWSAMNK